MLRGSFPKMIWYAGNCCIIREHGGALHTMPAFARKASGYVFLWAIAPLVVADRIGGFIGKIVEARQDRPDTDGQGRAHQKPAREDDKPRPLGVYGQSKLGGELAVRERLKSHIILRTSWIFSAHGQNFVKTILRLANTKPELRVVADQIGGPTAADDVATAILDIIAISTAPKFGQWGTYHFSGTPAVSWFEFANAIVAHRGAVVLPIATQDYPLPARRPSNSVLDCSRIYSVFGIVQPDWRVALRNVLNELAVKS